MKKKQPGEWLKTSEAAAVLKCSTQTLYRRRVDRTFVEGKHYRCVGSRVARRPTYLYHYLLCAQALGLEAEG